VRLQGALGVLMERLANHMDTASSEESAFPSEQQPALEDLLDQLTDEGTLGPEIDRHYLREAAISEAVGLGPLDRLLANRAVREIVVDGPTRVLADLGGGLTPVAAFFSGEAAVLSVARRLLRRAGQELQTDQPIQEAQLPGGGSLQLLLPPLSPKGPLIAVRCPMRAQNSPESFVADGVLSQEMLTLLRGALQQRKNILVFGPSGAGVSHLLAMLTRLLPEHERIVTIEHTPRASLLNPQVLPLSRKALPEANLAELLRRAAPLRYDRLVLDDLYPEELWSALFVAAGSGGVLLGTHAPNPAVALSLVEFGARGGQNARAVPAQLMAAALQFLVHVGPDASGTRRVLSIGELRITPAETLELRTHFRHDGKAFVASFLGR
jgi:pilus assembly protein CpaF